MVNLNVNNVNNTLVSTVVAYAILLIKIYALWANSLVSIHSNVNITEVTAYIKLMISVYGAYLDTFYGTIFAILLMDVQVIAIIMDVICVNPDIDDKIGNV